MAETGKNLQTAFAGESQANQTYHNFAKMAEKEGFPGVARLFRAAAAAETVHAQNHMAAMGTSGSTADNLKAAMAGEREEFTSMYPAFVAAADREGNKQARQSFQRAMEVEKIHYELYEKAAKRIEAGSDLPYTNMFVCRGCGNTVEDVPPDRCPICGAPKSWFMWIE